MEFFVNLPMACINAAIADHFVMLFRYMPDEAFYEFHNGDGFLHVSVIFMPVVMEGDKTAIIFVNPGSGDNGTPQITPGVFYGGFWVTFVRFCIDVEAVLMFLVTAGFHFFEGRAGFFFHFIKKGGAESIAEVGIVEVIGIAPETIIAVTTFRNETVYVRVPFQIPAKGVENHDEAGSKVHGLILFKKHVGNNIVYGMKETVKEGTVIQEKLPELLINGKDTVAVGYVDKLKRHGGSAHGVEISTGRAKMAVAAEGDEFQLSAMRAAIHCSAKSGIAAVDHFLHIFDDRVTGM